jgi:hypothetical protein
MFIGDLTLLIPPLSQLVFHYCSWFPDSSHSRSGTKHLAGTYLQSSSDIEEQKSLALGILMIDVLQSNLHIKKLVPIASYFSLSTYCSHPKCLFYKGYLYVFRKHESIRFHPFSLIPQILPVLPKEREEYVVIGYRDFLYAMGGRSNGEIVNRVDRLNVLCPEKWEQISPLQRPRADFASCVYNDKLYVLGGMDHYMQQTEMSSSLKCKRKDVAESQTIRHMDEGYNQYPGITWGGGNYLRSIEVWDDTKETWQVQDFLPRIFGQCCACVTQNKIWIAEDDYANRRPHVDMCDANFWLTPNWKIQRMKNVTHMLSLDPNRILFVSQWMDIVTCVGKNVTISPLKTSHKRLQNCSAWKDWTVMDAVL